MSPHVRDRTSRGPGPLVAALLLVPTLLVHAAHAHDAHRDAPDAPDAAQRFPAERLRVYDAVVVDRHGRRQSFARDILADAPTVVTFTYTRCETVCLMSNAIFGALQAELDAAGDADTRLVSISIDPDRDRAADLARLGETFGAGERWRLVSGSRPEIGALLRSFGLQLGAVEDHDPMFLVGSPREGRYVRVTGLPEPEELRSLLRARAWEEDSP